MSGILIALEGIDCCGKSAQLQPATPWLAWLRSGTRRPITWGAEPTDDWSPIGNHIRAILQKREPFPGCFELQRLFVIDRAQDLFCRIEPELARGAIRLQERYALSTIAYGMLDGDASEYIRLHREIIGPRLRWPDLSIIVDISAEEAVRRQSRRDGQPPAELFEKKELLEKVRANYLALRFRTGLGQIAVVNGEQAKEAVSAEIQDALRIRLGIALLD